jgi:hypothetical protein
MKLNQQMKTTMSLAAAMGCLALTTNITNGAVLITPTGVSVSASGEWGGFEATKTFDSVGLSATPTLANVATVTQAVDGGGAGMWLGPTTPVPRSITWNLGAEYDLDGAWIWNYQQTNAQERGIDDFTIYVGGSGDAAATTPLGAANISLYPTGSTAQLAEFEGFSASGVQYVRFEMADANSNAIGLSEVRFQEAVPEPTTTALLGLGGLALILRRRK